MRKTMSVLLAGLMLIGVANTARAITVRGISSCGEWVSHNNDQVKWRAQTWLLGFLSGLAAGTKKDVLDSTDNESVYLWMDNYCKANPLKGTHDGAGYLYLELMEQKGIK